MFIKSIVIDGFKSYAQRTEINGFDPLFNAITGLNGSGKSNILDAICFLLGITNLQQVRAGSLQELVYKGGQAGVTKATVSISFDNTDKKQSPLGYETYDEITVTRQVVIGGRNKYLINGSNANNTRVQDLFRSVQLNVNNPHFLIMQGRITKVLNMKPPEILSMIEEAAGTRMYESKKASAEKTIEKKDAKLKEIDSILHEEITPTLVKLKEERTSYLEYQKVMRELEHLTKLHLAYQFVCAEDQKKKSVEELANLKETVLQLQRRQAEIDQNMQQLEEMIDNLSRQRDAESRGEIDKLEKELQTKRPQEAKVQSNLGSVKESLKVEQKKKRDLLKQKNEDTSSIQEKEQQMENMSKLYDEVMKQYENDEETHKAAQQHYQAVSAGLSSNTDGEDATIAEQLMTAKQEISRAATETKQAQMILKHNKDEIKKKQADLKHTEHTYKKDQSDLAAIEKDVKQIEAQMAKLNYEDGDEEELFMTRRNVALEVQDLSKRIDDLESRFPQLQFEYMDPEKNFDRRKVKGMVAKLIKLKDVSAATALEVTAGGKLYNIIVDTDVTGKKILDKGQLRRRYTIIPLNKIQSNSIPDGMARKAKSLVGADRARTALSLIGCEPDLDAAMKYVFGNSFVCSNMDVAKEVTFHPQIKKRSVTLAGESFDPQGTLSGGARQQVKPVLEKLQEMADVEQQLFEKRQELEVLDKKLDQLKKVAEKYRHLKEQHEIKCHDKKLVEMRQQQGSHHQQLEEIKAMQAAIDKSESVLSVAKENEHKLTEKVKDLEYKVKNAKKIREQELKTAEKEIANTKKKVESSAKEMKEKQQVMDTLKLEVEELKQALDSYNGQIEAVDQAISSYEQQIHDTSEELSNVKAEIKEMTDKLKKAKEELKAKNQEIHGKQQDLDKQKHERNKAANKLHQFELDQVRLEKNNTEMATTVQQMLAKHDWIAEERNFFGEPNTAYDFTKNDPSDAAKRLQKLQETKGKLAKSVNMRAMTMLGKAEEQYNDLMKKKKIVENDKAKITAIIAELDEKKNEALTKAHRQVNKDFGSIFSTLLPGTKARLSPPDGQTVLDGLEVKVAFGDVWKESLSELSGGQRSLVALSLILSMLLFKPAPLYILDEVDAALDLSHTQNIGQMLRTHFQHSQFIVVSLKDGMFNNANVLFKTKFVDGISTVQRFSQVQYTSRAATSTSSNTGNQTKKFKKT